MSTWDGYLTNEEVDAITNVIIAAGLATETTLPALLGQIPPSFAAQLHGGALVPKLRIKTQLRQMSNVHNLTTGEVPLSLYLSTVADAMSDAAHVTTIETFLAKVDNISGPGPAIGALSARRAFADPARFAGGGNGGDGNGIGNDGEFNLEITPEAMIAGTDETIPIQYLQQGLEAAASVFKILVHRHIDGAAEFLPGDTPRLGSGTGWMIGPGLIVTNHHVINARMSFPVPEPPADPADFKLQAETAQVLFDYFEADSPSHQITLEPEALVASDPGLDFAILRLPATAPERDPLRLRKRIIRKTPAQALGTRVNVLQHPGGKPMRLGFRSNFVVFGDDDILSYLTDTSSGSSGSPVCDDAWFVAGLHTGSQAISNQEIELFGKLVRRENVGTPLPTLMDFLKTNHRPLHDEIIDGAATG